MRENFMFEYVNENEYKKLERSLRKYNMLAFKKLYYEYYPKLKEGNFLGDIVDSNNTNGSKRYELKLPTDVIFSKVHGDIKLHYIVYEKNRTVMLDSISPEDILSEGHQSELSTYKGIMVSNEHPEEDMFKINLLKMLQK